MAVKHPLRIVALLLVASVLVMPLAPVALAQEGPTGTQTSVPALLAYDLPADWAALESGGLIVLTNQTDALLTLLEGQPRASGQIVVYLLSPHFLQARMDVPAEAELPEAINIVIGALNTGGQEFATLAEPDALEVDDLTLLRSQGSDENRTSLLLGRELADGQPAMLVAGTPAGEMEQYLDTLFELVQSLEPLALDNSLTPTTLNTGNAVDVEFIAPLFGHTDWVRDLTFSPDGTLLYSASDDGTVRTWDVGTGENVNILAEDGDASYIFQLAFSPDGTRLVTAHQDGLIKMWQAASGTVSSRFLSHDGDVFALAFSPDGQSLLAGGDDGQLRAWNVSDIDALAAAETEDDESEPAPEEDEDATTEDGEQDAPADEPATQPVESLEPAFVLSGHDGAVRTLIFDAASNQLLSAGEDGTVRIWDLETQAETQVIEAHQNWIRDMELSPLGSTLATASDDGTVKLWNPADGTEIATMQHPAPANYVLSLAYSPDGGLIATGTDTGGIFLWDAETGAMLAMLPGHFDYVRDVIFNPAGNLLISSGDDNLIRLWGIVEAAPVEEETETSEGEDTDTEDQN